MRALTWAASGVSPSCGVLSGENGRGRLTEETRVKDRSRWGGHHNRNLPVTYSCQQLGKQAKPDTHAEEAALFLGVEESLGVFDPVSEFDAQLPGLRGVRQANRWWWFPREPLVGPHGRKTAQLGRPTVPRASPWWVRLRLGLILSQNLKGSIKAGGGGGCSVGYGLSPGITRPLRRVAL